MTSEREKLEQALLALPVGASFFVHGARMGDKDYQKTMAAVRRLRLPITAAYTEHDEIFMTAGIRFYREADDERVKT